MQLHRLVVLLVLIPWQPALVTETIAAELTNVRLLSRIDVKRTLVGHRASVPGLE